MFEPSHIVVKPFKGLKTLKVSVKLIWLLPIPNCEPFNSAQLGAIPPTSK